MQQRELMRVAEQMAERYGLDPEIFVRQIMVESNFNPAARNEKSGAAGLDQVMSATAQKPGYGVTPLRDRYDPVESLRFGAEYMRAMLDKYDGDYQRALAAYNAGPGVVDRAGGVPGIEETQNYVSKILNSNSLGSVRPVARPVNPGVTRPQSVAPLAEQRNQAIRAALLEAAGGQPTSGIGSLVPGQ